MGDIRHKFITDAELHDPKGFGTASNKTVLTKDENGVSRYVATTVLEKALNFVDGNASPPTEVLGAIYVLIDEGNGAVDSGWDGASYDDWVRFNGTTWVAYTPSEGVFCYNATDNTLYLFTTSWDQYGVGENMANSNLTLDANRTHDLSGYNLTFSGGTTIHEGADTLSSSSHTKMYDGDTTPNLLWDWRNNGDVHSSGTGVIYGNITSDSSSNTPFTVRRDSSTVNNSLFFPQQLKNSSSSYVDYAQFSTRILSNTASSESGQFTINLKNSGSNVAVFDSGNVNGTVLNVAHATGQKFAVSGFITVDSTGQTTIEGGGTRTLAVKRANTTGSTGIHFDNSSKTAGEIYTSYASGNAYNMTFALDSGSGLTTVLQVTPTKTNLKNQINAADLPTYADDAAAGAGGLITGDLYVETTSGNRYVASKS